MGLMTREGLCVFTLAVAGVDCSGRWPLRRRWSMTVKGRHTMSAVMLLRRRLPPVTTSTLPRKNTGATSTICCPTSSTRSTSAPSSSTEPLDLPPCCALKPAQVRVRALYVRCVCCVRCVAYVACAALDRKCQHLVHVKSSVTWQLNSQYMVSSRWPIIQYNYTLIFTAVEIWNVKDFGVITWTFWGHVRSSVTWRNSRCAVALVFLFTL